jgi:uncharacterized protein with ParB-like and HNH nuclease domain
MFYHQLQIAAHKYRYSTLLFIAGDLNANIGRKLDESETFVDHYNGQQKSIRCSKLSKAIAIFISRSILFRKIIEIYRNFDGKLLYSYFTTVSEVFLELIAPNLMILLLFRSYLKPTIFCWLTSLL